MRYEDICVQRCSEASVSPMEVRKSHDVDSSDGTREDLPQRSDCGFLRDYGAARVTRQVRADYRVLYGGYERDGREHERNEGQILPHLLALGGVCPLPRKTSLPVRVERKHVVGNLSLDRYYVITGTQRTKSR